MSVDPSHGLVLMTLTRSLSITPFPPPLTEPWQGQPLGVWAYSLTSSNILRTELFRTWDAMREGDPNVAMIPIVPGTYRLVNGGEPMVEFNAVAGKEMKEGVLVQRLYWVEKAEYSHGV